MKNLSLCMILLALTACGRVHSMSDSDRDTSLGMMDMETSTQQSEQYSYSVSKEDCKTDSYVFGTKDAYCKALKDSELNHGCALEERKVLFESHCEGFGSFDSTEEVPGTITTE